MKKRKKYQVKNIGFSELPAGFSRARDHAKNRAELCALRQRCVRGFIESYKVFSPTMTDMSKWPVYVNDEQAKRYLEEYRNIKEAAANGVKPAKVEEPKAEVVPIVTYQLDDIVARLDRLEQAAAQLMAKQKEILDRIFKNVMTGEEVV